MYRAGRYPGGRDGAVFRCGDAGHARRSLVGFDRGRKGMKNDYLVVFGCGEIGFEFFKLGLPARPDFRFLRSLFRLSFRSETV